MIKKLFVIAYALFITILAGAQELNYREIAYPYDDSGDVICLIQGYSVYADILKIEKGVDLEGDIPYWKVFTVDGRSYHIGAYLSGARATYLIYLKEGSAAMESCYSSAGTTDYSKIGFVGNGKFVMPDYVHYNGKQYPVTKILEGSVHEGRFGSVSSLVISNTVTEIGDNAFRVNEDGAQYKPFLTSVVIGNSVKRIGERAFANQTLLTDVEVNSSVETVGKEAFSNCAMKTIDWKGSFKTMGEGVFSYCNQLETVNLNCEMDTLPKCTFLMCKNLSSVSLSNNIRVIEQYAFAGTEKLTSMVWPTNLETIEVRAFGRYNLQDYCGLNKLECPSGLKSIKLYAFEGCKLEEIRFNEGLEELGLFTFNVEFLKDIYCPSFIEAGNKNEGAFILGDDTSRKPEAWNKSYWEKTKLHVPHDLMQKFYDTAPWSYFTIVDMETGEPFVPSENPSEKVCAKPSIDIDNGELIFTCETEDVEYVTTINCYDVGTLVHRENIKLAGTYVITSYAKRERYENSEIVKVTLFWLPKGQNEEIGIEDVALSPSRKAVEGVRPVLISSNSGTVTVQGEKVCAKPSIDIDNGELKFTCETEDVEFVTSISCNDVGTLVHRENIKLAGTYVITSYAKREGYENSEIVKVTLFWLPKGNNEEIGIDDAVDSSRPVLISSNGGTLTIQGAEAGSMVTVYDLSGRRLSAAKANGTTTSIATTLKKGDTAIVRVGEKSMKVLMQ